MKFWIENRVCGIGYEVIGTFTEAFHAAKKLLYSDISLIAIYNEKNEKVCELRWGGFCWMREDYR